MNNNSLQFMRNKPVIHLRKISGRFKTFDSFEELSKHELQQMAQLNGIEILNPDLSLENLFSNTSV